MTPVMILELSEPATVLTTAGSLVAILFLLNLYAAARSRRAVQPPQVEKRYREWTDSWHDRLDELLHDHTPVEQDTLDPLSEVWVPHEYVQPFTYEQLANEQQLVMHRQLDPLSRDYDLLGELSPATMADEVADDLVGQGWIRFDTAEWARLLDSELVSA